MQQNGEEIVKRMMKRGWAIGLLSLGLVSGAWCETGLAQEPPAGVTVRVGDQVEARATGGAGEGRKREVRRLWEATGATVSRLIRVRFGPIVMGNRLFAGRSRPLEPDELKQLLQAAGLKDEKRAHRTERPAPSKGRRQKPAGRPGRGRQKR